MTLALLPPEAAPPIGERSVPVLTHANVRIEQILSGDNATPQDYLQDHDEWAVVLAGAAVIQVDGERLQLGPGDSVFLPALVPHTVVETSAGTSWLAVHIPPA